MNNHKPRVEQFMRAREKIEKKKQQTKLCWAGGAIINAKNEHYGNSNQYIINNQ